MYVSSQDIAKIVLKISCVSEAYVVVQYPVYFYQVKTRTHSLGKLQRKLPITNAKGT